MTRSSYPTGFNDTEVNIFSAVKMEFDSATIGLWSGYSDITIAGVEYLGTGALLGISEVEETSEISARGVTITVSGLDESILAIALNEPYQNRALSVLIGTIDGTTVDSYTLFRGRMDVMKISESGGTTSISITAENRLIDLERPRSARYTSEDQKRLFAGDKGLDYVADIQDKALLWGVEK